MKVRIEFELPTTVKLSLEGAQERESELAKGEPVDTGVPMDAGRDHGAPELPRPGAAPEVPGTAEAIDAGSAPDAPESPVPSAETPSREGMKVGRGPGLRLLPPLPPAAEPAGTDGAIDAGGDPDGPPGPPLPPDAIARTMR